MRQIIFKAKDKNNNWVKGFYFKCNTYGKHYIYLENGLQHKTEIDRDTLCQFTGLKDKNGVDIYEGDLVNYLDATGVVIYENNTAIFTVKFRTSTWSFDSMDYDILTSGNIHD